jgi:hypothetical protein
MRKPIFLPPPLDAGNPFRVGRALTICAAAMVYACRHPYGKFLRDGSVGDYEDFIRTNQTSWNAYCDLMRRAERGSLPLKKAVYLRDGRLDPRRTRIAFEVLLELARDRGDADARLVELAQRAPSAGGTRATSGPASEPAPAETAPASCSPSPAPAPAPSPPAQQPDTPEPPTSPRRSLPDRPKPPLSEAELRDFLVKLGEEAGRPLSQRECAAAVRARFPDHRVSRDRVRKMHPGVFGRQRPGKRSRIQSGRRR